VGQNHFLWTLLVEIFQCSPFALWGLLPLFTGPSKRRQVFILGGFFFLWVCVVGVWCCGVLFAWGFGCFIPKMSSRSRCLIVRCGSPQRILAPKLFFGIPPICRRWSRMGVDGRSCGSFPPTWWLFQDSPDIPQPPVFNLRHDVSASRSFLTEMGFSCSPPSPRTTIGMKISFPQNPTLLFFRDSITSSFFRCVIRTTTDATL